MYPYSHTKKKRASDHVYVSMFFFVKWISAIALSFLVRVLLEAQINLTSHDNFTETARKAGRSGRVLHQWTTLRRWANFGVSA